MTCGAMQEEEEVAGGRRSKRTESVHPSGFIEI